LEADLENIMPGHPITILILKANKPVFFQQSRNFFWDAGTGSLAITVSQFKFIDVSKSSKVLK